MAPPPFNYLPDIVLSLGAEGGTQQIANNTAVDCEALIEQERKSINVHLLFHTYTGPKTLVKNNSVSISVPQLNG